MTLRCRVCVGLYMKCFMCCAKEFRVHIIGTGKLLKDFKQGKNVVNSHFVKIYPVNVWRVNRQKQCSAGQEAAALTQVMNDVEGPY